MESFRDRDKGVRLQLVDREGWWKIDGQTGGKGTKHMETALETKISAPENLEKKNYVTWLSFYKAHSGCSAAVRL